MKKKYFFLVWFLVLVSLMRGQSVALPVKSNLSTTLNTGKTFTNATAFDTIVLPYSGAEEFTLELKAQVNSAVGRGLDVQFTNSKGLGFRTSLDKTKFNNSAAYPALENLSAAADNGQLQTYRYAVKDGFVNIYQDGYFLTTKELTSLTDDSSASEVTYGPDNGIGNWAGLTGNNTGKPSDYGWSNSAVTSLFNTANSTSGVRYIDVTSGHTIESTNTAYSGRLLYIRWDGDAYSSSVYSFPVKLEKDVKYEFSWLYEYIANATAGAVINVAVSTGTDGSGAIVSKSFTTGSANKLRDGNFSFTASASGTYYLTITGARALFGIANLNLKSTNAINNWDGPTVGNSGKPSDYGWVNAAAPTIFNTANGTSGTRYMDVTTGHTFESDGANFSGRLLYIRWDGSAFSTSNYTFPVALKAAKDYNFSWIYEYLSNAAPGAKIKVSICTAADGTGIITSKEFTTGNANKLRKGDFFFHTQNDATYYVTISGAWALFGIGDMVIKEQKAAKLIVGKNYATGAVNIGVNSITYDTAAYAPVAITSVPDTAVTLTGTEVSVGAYSKSKVILNSAVSLHLTNGSNPLINSKIEFNSTDARIYFDAVKPANITDLLQKITLNGVQAQNNVNVYVSGSGQGSLIVSYASDFKPLEVFTEENFTGSSQKYLTITPNTALGSFDNSIKSFKLKRGYMATFATNSDGTGYSRVYRADDQDIEIAVMPLYLKGTISFLRTMRLNEVSKKGLAGGNDAAISATNISWYYNWNTGMNTTPTVEYVPIRQTYSWPSFTAANTKEGYTHLLGYNEPDRPDQANIPVETAIAGWPGLMQSGLRLGSPCTSDPFNPWLNNFMTQAEAKNYRVDYMVLHCYWYKSAAQWSSDLLSIYNKYKRPIWITEWNIGANWTGNNFPDGPTVLTDANATKHKNDLAAVLQVLENADYVERYSIYNWVQDARAIYVTIDDAFKTRNPNWASYVWLQTAPVISTATTGNTVLTPAGQYYANLASKKAYNPAKEYLPTWNPIVENLSYEFSKASDSISVKWTGANYDLINKYVLERKLPGESNFSVFYESTDATKLKVTDVVHSTAEYRMKVLGKDNTASAYSTVLVFTQDAITSAPANLTATALSISKIDLKWSSVIKANSYNLKRATSQQGVYQTIAAFTKDTIYSDIGLNENTMYYYKVSAVNSGGESVDSGVVSAKTKLLGIPDKVTNVLIGSGDGQVKLKWDFMYDAKFYVKRALSSSGTYTTIATVDGTSYKDVSVANGTNYYYKVSAFNTVGEGLASDVGMALPNIGQLAYYNFEESSGLISKDIWGNFTGTHGAANTRGTGKTGTGLYFDGTASSYLDIEDGIVENLNDFTITTWVYLNSLTNWTRIFDFGDSTTSWMALEAANGSGKISYEIVSGGLTNSLKSEYALPLNEWVQVTLDQHLDVCKIFVNGTEVISGPVTIKPSALGNSKENYLGKSKYAADPYLNGRIDEFKIYNYSLNNAGVSVAKSVRNDKSQQLESETEVEVCNFYSTNHTLYSHYNGTKFLKYSLFDVSGKFLKTGKINSGVQTELGTFMSGVYIVVVNDGTTHNAVKVLIK